MSDRIEESQEPWQAIPRAVLRDKRLSPRAKGGLVTLLSHDAGWVRSCLAILQRECNCGRDQARAIMRELADLGYARLDQTHGAGGRFTTAYVVTPHAGEPARSDTGSRGSPGTGTPDPVAPEAELPLTVVEPVDGHPQDVELAPKARPRDPIWDVFVDCFGEPTSLTRGAWNKAAGSLREYEADPEELRAFILAVRDTDNAWAAVTPMAAAKHFGSRASLTTIGGGRHNGAARTHALAEDLRERGL